MSIDFSKAPEGATHYYDFGCGLLWYRCSVGAVEFWHNGVWVSSDEFHSSESLTAIPTFEQFVSVEDNTKLGELEALERVRHLISDKHHRPSGSKHDSGKPLMGAVPPNALLAVAKVLTFGAEKYGRDNWRKVENAETRYLDAALRHINAYQRGEAADPESGENHLAHAVCSLMFMLELQEGE